MKQTSIIEISKSAIINNIGFIKETLGENVRVSSVVKANAYGHGVENFVPIAESCGIDHFSVFSAMEAFRVKQVLKQPTTDVMIMGHIGADEIEWVIQNGVEFFVFNFCRLQLAVKVAEELGIKAKIHIEIETGLNRTGFEREELKQVISLLKTYSANLTIKGLCTHYAGAESIANHVRVQRQISKFNKTYKWFVKNGITPEIRHTACSAAAFTYENTRMDMVRIGIMQYGFWSTDETRIHYFHKHKGQLDRLERVMSWKSTVMSVKTVKTGEFISYGTTFLAQEDKKIAIVPVGYSHGFSRTLSNQGRVLVRGRRCAVIGLINMNMLIVDVTGIDSVKYGDEVVMIGRQGKLSISVHSFSQLSDQLNYELLTRLPSDTKRKIVK
ncbi:MAG: alanine racemase [Bacteroidetes bacterium]|nr:alanine racemase [Bacteroidota bacterium]MBU1720853.1 alanine racemase [Bacteroidota bacterium]